ncbi:MAG: MGMT family protein, partial [Minwuiales bacterium]|nr:MGMT family protein [Minwuiales bacterium]
MSETLGDRIAAVIRMIPSGTVTSYGRVAAIAGNQRASRRVVWVLRSPAYDDLPWHRVLNRDGRISLPRGGGFELQAALLSDEGVEVD